MPSFYRFDARPAFHSGGFAQHSQNSWYRRVTISIAAPNM
jgi:hypothetical protein